jgi:hypothetical protein
MQLERVRGNMAVPSHSNTAVGAPVEQQLIHQACGDVLRHCIPIRLKAENSNQAQLMPSGSEARG